MNAGARRFPARLAAGAVLCSLGMLAAGAAILAAARAPAAHAATSTAVVVVDTGTSVRHAVIHFDGTIDGIRALELAGGNPTTYGYAGQGAAVCSIDGVGNPADQSCLIGPNGEYWAYHRSTAGAESWSYSRGCACTTTVRDGDVEGWRYGLGAAPRASASFCSYVACPPPPPPNPPAPTSSGGALPGAPGPEPGPSAPGPGVPGAAGGGGGTGGGARTAPPTAAGPTETPPSDAESPDAAATSTTATSRPATTAKQRKEADARVASASNRAGGSNGSPAGVAVAAGVLAVSVAAGVMVRRRRRAPG